MADEEFYLQVENELKEGTKDEALWSKAKIVAEENKTEPQLEYTKMRVEQLKKEARKDQVATGVARIISWWPKLKPWVIGYLILVFIGFILSLIFPGLQEGCC